MKNVMSIIVIVIGLMTITSCSSKCENKTDNLCPNKTEVYTGVIPAADALGLRYTLLLSFNDDNSRMNGDYKAVETFLAGDTASITGVKDMSSFISAGNFSLIKGDGENTGKSYIKLEQGKGEKSIGEPYTTFFLIDSDSTITMVNEMLQPSEMPGVNYTLKLVK